MTDPNREYAEDAALDYSEVERERRLFAVGWLMFCDNEQIPPWWAPHTRAGYIAARDAPE